MFGRKKIQQEFQGLAASWGLNYSPDDQFGIRDWPFDLITARWIRNVVWGQWRGRNLTAFDYDQIATTRPGKSAQVYRYTCAFGETAAPFSKLRIEGHGGYADWLLGKPKGLSPVQTGNEGPDGAFRVLAADPVSAGEVLTPELLRWLLSLDRGWAFEVMDHGVLCSTGRLAPVAFPSVLDTLSEFLDRLHAR